MAIRKPGPGLPSDAVYIRCGLDGWEPECFKSILRDHPTQVFQRLTFALNTYYPEIAGAYYLNRQVFALFDLAFMNLGFNVVDFDCFVPEGFVPAESFVALDEGTCYLVADDAQKVIGYAVEWRFGCGVDNSYYDDRFLLDFLFSDVDLSKICHCIISMANVRVDVSIVPGCNVLD